MPQDPKTQYNTVYNPMYGKSFPRTNNSGGIWGSLTGGFSDLVGGFSDLINNSKPQLPGITHPTLGSGGQWGSDARNMAAAAGRRDAPTSAWEQDQRGLAGYLQGQMSGQNSLSREQLRQDTGRNMAMQQALAASANPQNAAMAQRMASQNAGRINQGMAGQAAMAGIAERNAAANAYGGLAGQARGQDMQGYFQQQGANDAMWLGSMGLGLGASQSQLSADTQYEALKQQQALAQANMPGSRDKLIGTVLGGASAISAMGGGQPPQQPQQSAPRAYFDHSDSTGSSRGWY
jgi:hypothetical protein